MRYHLLGPGTREGLKSSSYGHCCHLGPLWSQLSAIPHPNWGPHTLPSVTWSWRDVCQAEWWWGFREDIPGPPSTQGPCFLFLFFKVTSETIHSSCPCQSVRYIQLYLEGERVCGSLVNLCRNLYNTVHIGKEDLPKNWMVFSEGRKGWS